MLKTLRQCCRTICSHAAWSPARQRWISVSMASGWADEASGDMEGIVRRAAAQNTTDVRRARGGRRARAGLHGMITGPREPCPTPFLQHHPGGFRIESVTAADVAAAPRHAVLRLQRRRDARRLPPASTPPSAIARTPSTTRSRPTPRWPSSACCARSAAASTPTRWARSRSRCAAGSRRARSSSPAWASRRPNWPAP